MVLCVVLVLLLLASATAHVDMAASVTQMQHSWNGSDSAALEFRVQLRHSGRQLPMLLGE